MTFNDLDKTSFIMNKRNMDICYKIHSYTLEEDCINLQVSVCNLGYTGNPFVIDVTSIKISKDKLKDFVALTDNQVFSKRNKPGVPE